MANEEIANKTIKSFRHKRAHKRPADILKSISLTTPAILQMSNSVLQCRQKPFELKMFVSLAIDPMTVLGKASQLISAEGKDKLKPAPNKVVRSLCDDDHTTFDYLFQENISESF